ncbi:hypothetical protein EZ428_00905 [Pedobacter frigiditerrae]|uniref:DUF748 domain-containing protein n=1 Tax=Pedobacter frigiditerrae TaxID=2530452 RepID=A0A4R0N0V9_9SPHI|nr:hypothetical protein [Pedobacter frigiditerrae]TCC93361.1 hypothetical protein EZ428_00905 [Pedobacter frigiditerrae]
MPAKKRNTKKILTWVGGISLTLIILIGGVAIYFSAKWKPLLTEKIKAGVYEGSNHLYKIDFQDIHLNLVTGTIVLDSIKLTPDTTVFNQLKSIKRAPAHLFRIKLAHLNLKRVSVLKAYFSKEIIMNDIILDNPSIDMVYHKVPKRTDTLDDDRTLYQQISKSLKSIRVLNIKVIDADFDYYNGSKKLNAVKHLSINVKDVLIDSLAQFDTTRVFHAKDIAFAMADYRSLTTDKMYTIKVDTVRGSLNKKTLRVVGVQLIPMYPDLAFSRKYNAQKDRYDLKFDELSFSGIDFISLNNDGNLHAKRLNIGPAKVAVFLNRELPPAGFNKGRNYPHNALKRLGIETLIDTLTLNKLDIAYTEYNPKTKERGTLKLDNLSGQILNITNDSLRLTKRNHAYADLTTYVMGTAKLNVKIDFNLTSKDAAFSYMGHVSPFDLKVLNPLSRSLGLVSINTGSVKSVDFTINANERGSAGVVKFAYNDLKVNLLKEDENGVKEKKGLLSFLANTVLIKNDNPTKDEPLRVANITFTRVPQASFFNLMWKSVFIGIRESVGLGIVPVKPMKEPVPSKKAERIKKRTERKAEKAKN